MHKIATRHRLYLAIPYMKNINTQKTDTDNTFHIKSSEQDLHVKRTTSHGQLTHVTNELNHT